MHGRAAVAPECACIAPGRGKRSIFVTFKDDLIAIALARALELTYLGKWRLLSDPGWAEWNEAQHANARHNHRPH